MSEWKSESPLSQINRSAGKTSIQCSDSLVAAITKSLFVAEITKGAFDPTWACMWDIWNFNTSTVPGKQEINSRLPFVDWEKVEVRGNFVFLQKEGMLLGLGGIAKGVALDDARETLLLQGVNDFMLQCGGQILAQGKERVIGIRNPDGLPHEIIGKVSIKNQSISTSGNYEKYFILDDIRYHHILDPRTGYPAIGMKSVTVVTENAALGDALSTALFVMGTGKGMLFVERTVGVEVLFIDSESVIHKSSGFILN
jgi:thiamine biosynthesis lipoprotein